MTREQVNNLRMNEFGIRNITYISGDKDDYPNRFEIVKWEKHKPYKVFSLDVNDYVVSRESCYVIGYIEWNPKEPCWEFKSCGTRYLECSTPELNEWILKFCNKYEVADNELIEVI